MRRKCLNYLPLKVISLRFPYLLLLLPLLLSACATSPPVNQDNICAIFREKDDWYEDAKDAQDKWQIAIPIQLAFIHQESRFVHDARPPRKKYLGFIPGARASNSYGYSQALTGTWKAYQRGTGHYGADRDDFADSVDFIAWYNRQSVKRSGIDAADTYHLYLAYHEGHGGFNKRSFKKKAWLKKVATKVSVRARKYASQLAACEADLQKKSWFFGLF